MIGFIGPLTGEEGHSVSVVFDAVSPPVLYLGQKRIPEKPFLCSFGLTPQQESRAVLLHLATIGKDDLIFSSRTTGTAAALRRRGHRSPGKRASG